MDNLILEKKIRETLDHKADEVEADFFAEERIRATVHQRLEETSMKKKNWKKTAVVAAAICVIGSMTALGLGRTVSISGQSDIRDSIYSYAEAKEKQDSLDKEVKMVEKFSNGYTFHQAVPMEETGHDENGNETETSTMLYVDYKKKGMEDVSLYTHRLSGLEVGAYADEELTLEDGTVLKYATMINRFVPNGYEISDEERELMAVGKLNIGYGGPDQKLEEKVSSSVTWEQDGIAYDLFTFSDEMSAEEMFGMARELAESE